MSKSSITPNRIRAYPSPLSSQYKKELNMQNLETLKPTIMSDDAWADILSDIDLLSQQHAKKTTAIEKKTNGQIFTPLAMAKQLVSLIDSFDDKIGIYADAGTGTGILSAALLARHSIKSSVPPKSLIAYEKDDRLHADWNVNFSKISKKLKMDQGSCNLQSDFYQEAESILTSGKTSCGSEAFRLVLNPPYKKLGSKEHLSILLKKHGIYAPNHYAAFMGLSVKWLKDDGELLAIIPRSFFNGTYFEKFRKWLSSNVSVEHIVSYCSRSNFGKNVLQENVCLYLKKCKQRPLIRVSYCEHAEASPLHDLLIPQGQVLKDVWVLPSTPSHILALKENSRLPHTLGSLGLSVTTGAVEVHRAECKKNPPTKVLYSRDFDADGVITWGELKKPRYFASSRGVFDLPDDNSGFVVIKRITANDGNKNRLLPVWVSKETTELSKIGFDNHVQVFSYYGKPIPKKEGAKLVEFLRKKGTNLCMSAVNGTTQINVNDLLALRFPSIS
jgi:tRNA1(Val) A37 N6-methylase TrmN6